MDIYRCDFDVESDLLLGPSESELISKTPSGHSITFRNAGVVPDGRVPILTVSVIGSASSFDEAAQELRTVLANQLDPLGFLTHARFRILGPRRLIDWNDHQKRRRFMFFAQLDARFPPIFGLTKNYVDALTEFSGVTEYVHKALRNFRYGLLEDAPEDQFMRFWLALEIMAVNQHKGSSPEVYCRACNALAKCAACGKTPPPITSSKPAIVALTNRIVGNNAKKVHEKLFFVRNGLAHGKSAVTVLKDAGVSWEALLGTLGRLTSDAILLAINPQQQIPKPFREFAGLFVHQTLQGKAFGTFEFLGNGKHPAEESMPSPTFEIQFG